MNIAIYILLVSVLSLLALYLVQKPGKTRVSLSNIASGVHQSGKVARKLEVAFADRYLLAKQGTAADEIALNGADDRPIGVMTDEGVAGDYRNVQLLGAADATVRMVADGSINAGQRLYTAAAGKVTASPSMGSYQIGTAVTSAGDAEQVEVDPAEPVPYSTHRVIAAGVHDWAGGAATQDTISIPGLADGDVVVATLVGTGTTEELKYVTTNTTTELINLFLTAQGVDGTTKVSYAVYRAN